MKGNIKEDKDDFCITSFEDVKGHYREENQLPSRFKVKKNKLNTKKV